MFCVKNGKNIVWQHPRGRFLEILNKVQITRELKCNQYIDYIRSWPLQKFNKYWQTVKFPN